MPIFVNNAQRDEKNEKFFSFISKTKMLQKYCGYDIMKSIDWEMFDLRMRSTYDGNGAEQRVTMFFSVLYYKMPRIRAKIIGGFSS